MKTTFGGSIIERGALFRARMGPRLEVAMEAQGSETTWNGRCRQIGSSEKEEGKTGRSPITAVNKHVHITPSSFRNLTDVRKPSHPPPRSPAQRDRTNHSPSTGARVVTGSRMDRMSFNEGAGRQEPTTGCRTGALGLRLVRSPSSLWLLVYPFT
jgi:hypothetical protein